MYLSHDSHVKSYIEDHPVILNMFMSHDSHVMRSRVHCRPFSHYTFCVNYAQYMLLTGASASTPAPRRNILSILAANSTESPRS